MSITPKPFTVFDIDGTLIRWQLAHAVVHAHGVRGHLPASAHKRILQARTAWKQRATNASFTAYEDILVDEYLGALKHINTQQYIQVAQDVFEEYKDQTFTFTRDLLKDLKKQGYFLLAISGSHHEVVHLLAEYYGFDDALGAAFEQRDGAFTGNVDTPVFDKAAALQRLIAKHNLSTKDSYAIGDSQSDIPMLALTENPIAFNPDRVLYDEALKRHWRIVVERKNMTYSLAYANGQYILATEQSNTAATTTAGLQAKPVA